LVGSEQGLHLSPQGCIAVAGFIQVGGPIHGVGPVERGQENVSLSHRNDLGGPRIAPRLAAKDIVPM
jgi:hypothetical protein